MTAVIIATWGTGAALAAHLPLFATIPAALVAGVGALFRRGR